MSIFLGGAAGGGAPAGDTPVYINKLPYGADEVIGSILSPTQEQYNYRIASVSVAIVTVTYADAFKDFVLTVTVST